MGRLPWNSWVKGRILIVGKLDPTYYHMGIGRERLTIITTQQIHTGSLTTYIPADKWMPAFLASSLSYQLITQILVISEIRVQKLAISNNKG